MRNQILFWVVAILLLCAPLRSTTQAATPVLSELKLVTRLPGELPQRVEGLAQARLLIQHS
jgi:hypothetical protein